MNKFYLFGSSNFRWRIYLSEILKDSKEEIFIPNTTFSLSEQF